MQKNTGLRLVTYEDSLKDADRSTLMNEINEYASVYKQDPNDKTLIGNGLILAKIVREKAETDELKTACSNFEAILTRKL